MKNQEINVIDLNIEYNKKINIENIEKLTIDILEFGLNFLNFPYYASINVEIADSEFVREINNQTRSINKTTDVLSFPANEFIDYKIVEETMTIDYETDQVFLGDILINYDRVLSQAKEYNHSEKREYGFLLVHSLLHLLGYDHMNENDERIMFAKQREILDEYGLKR